MVSAERSDDGGRIQDVVGKHHEVGIISRDFIVYGNGPLRNLPTSQCESTVGWPVDSAVGDAPERSRSFSTRTIIGDGPTYGLGRARSRQGGRLRHRSPAAPCPEQSSADWPVPRRPSVRGPPTRPPTL